ncbi:MAG: aldehyde dehydrogenase family protein [Planctomycetes bacterium]|nr:aldehyde dehydrogenase family protein [Planctomycetota bacterium]
METWRNFIDGEWVESASGRAQEDTNPADTGEVLGRAPCSTGEEARGAVDAARRALPAWRATPAPVRARVIGKAAEVLSRRAEEVARLLTREEGKVLREARGEVAKSVNILEFMAGEGRRLNGETVPSELARTFACTLRAPLGVVGLITPWNFPVCIPCWKIAPALVAGNTVVFKPASLTPATAVEVVRVFEEAGVPRGVLNLVHGAGGEVGQALVEHPEVRALSFTGSNEVGTRLYSDGARQLKKVQCEMGGKNPIVVLDDADLGLAVEATVQGAFGSTGQRCTATSRAIVVHAVADEFVERVVARARRFRVGNGLDPAVDMGPSVDERQLETVLGAMDRARSEGARCRTGGTRLAEGDLSRGFFSAPAVFDEVSPSMRLAQDEVFGPVLAVLRVGDLEEAIEVANGVRFGLSSSVYTSDVSRAFRFTEAIETGIVHVNNPTMGGEAQLPFGGMKATGVGLREQGHVALDFFTELKTVYLDYTGTKRESNIF